MVVATAAAETAVVPAAAAETAVAAPVEGLVAETEDWEKRGAADPVADREAATAAADTAGETAVAVKVAAASEVAKVEEKEGMAERVDTLRVRRIGLQRRSMDLCSPRSEDSLAKERSFA